MADALPLLEREIVIAAAPARVWELVRDPRRMSEWSPTVVSTRLKDAAEPALGVRFTNRNRVDDLEWTTHGEIVGFDEERVLAFRIEENWAIWSFALADDPAGTRLTQRRETPDGISELSRELTDGFMGGQETFTAALLDGMEQTLRQIRSTAEFSG